MTPVFLVASLVVVATPGTGAVYTVNAGLLRGRRAALLAATACTVGVLPHLLASITGLAALLQASAWAYALLTWAGIAYLFYLAAMTWSDPGHDLTATATATATTKAPASIRTSRVLRDGVVLNLLNPKLTLFFVAFLPQFVPAGDDSTATMATLGGIFMLLTLIVFVVYGLGATTLRPLLRRHPMLAGHANKAFAATYVLIAAVLVTDQLIA